jgi:hypothetical protein
MHVFITSVMNTITRILRLGIVQSDESRPTQSSNAKARTH